MSDATVFQSGMHTNLRSRSMGLKLLVVGVLAMLMTIPSLFVWGLVEDRSQGAENAVQQSSNHSVSQQTLFGSSIKAVDSYRSINRSLKYVLLFLGLVFLTYFMFEVTTGKRVHPAQYLLVGTAQIIFYLLLLSIAEKIGFDFAYLIAAGATVGLLSVNAGWIFASSSQGMKAFAVFGLLYTLIYMLLRLEDDALLIGAIASFAAVAAAMYFTRKIDWYSSQPVSGPPA
jgi:inner membrane protein involved in colicin E2 resistance